MQVVPVILVTGRPDLAPLLDDDLRSRGFALHGSPTPAEVPALVGSVGAAAVVIDLDSVADEPASLVARIRTGSGAVILAFGTDPGRDATIAILDAGADDVVIGVPDAGELAARLRAILRRAGRAAGDGDVDPDGVVVDLDRHLVVNGAVAVPLTRTERRLLEMLAAQPGRLLTHEELLRGVWGDSYGTEIQYLRTFIGQLRRKLGDDARQPRLIATESGVGYRWIGADGS